MVNSLAVRPQISHV